MKNKIEDLNNYLFEQLERLQDDSLTDDQMQQEINRSRAVTSVASQIIQLGDLSLRATKLRAEYNNSVALPELLEVKA